MSVVPYTSAVCLLMRLFRAGDIPPEFFSKAMVFFNFFPFRYTHTYIPGGGGGGGQCKLERTFHKKHRDVIRERYLLCPWLI